MAQAEIDLQAKLPAIWDDLVLKSKNIDASLVKVKKKFTEITQEQITDFQKSLADFADRFLLEGPGAVGEDLDRGAFTEINYIKFILVIILFSSTP